MNNRITSTQAERLLALKARFGAWAESRREISEADGPDTEDWHNSDDDAIELLHDFALILDAVPTPFDIADEALSKAILDYAQTCFLHQDDILAVAQGADPLQFDTGDLREAIAAGSTAWTAAANASLRAIADEAKGGVK